MDDLKVFHLNNNKYYIFLGKNEDIIRSKIKKNFMKIISVEKPFIENKNNENNENILNLDEWEKMETLLRMTKYGFNKVYGWNFTKQHILINDLEKIKKLVNANIDFFNKYDLNKKWENNLDICIENEKKRHKNTTCFICCKKGHFAINCHEDFDIDGEYIGNEAQCKYCKKIIKKTQILHHEHNCKKYYSH